MMTLLENHHTRTKIQIAMIHHLHEFWVCYFIMGDNRRPIKDMRMKPFKVFEEANTFYDEKLEKINKGYLIHALD